MARQRIRKRPMSEINVVPYIDVMLVLLVIFMITAPLLTQGVKVELPQSSANPIEQKEEEPIVVTVDVDGNYFLNISETPETPIDHQTLVIKVAAIVQYKPKTQVLVRGDENVTYGKVVTAMGLLQKAGVPGVGLVTRSPDDEK
ncbi:MAG: protein TolR [Gammaproteobacteria bacterium]|nr:protein TolR [Gammaproteobacteria bacterium]